MTKIDSDLDRLLNKKFQLQNRYEIVMEGFEDVNMYASSISFPLTALTVEEVANVKFYEGYTVPDSVEIVFFCDVDFTAYNFIKSWLEDIFDFNTLEYRVLTSLEQKFKDAEVTYFDYKSFPYANALYNPKAEKLATKGYSIRGLSPKGLGEVKMSEDSGDNLMFTATFSVQNIVDSF